MISFRAVVAVLIGILAGGVVVGAIQLVGVLLFPLPVTMEQFQAMTWEEKHKLMHEAPPYVYAPVLVGYAVGMLAGGLMATLFWPDRKLTGAVIVGVFFTLVNILNVVTLPQPLWVTVVSFALFL